MFFMLHNATHSTEPRPSVSDASSQVLRSEGGYIIYKEFY